jgi:hypothetical protein
MYAAHAAIVTAAVVAALWALANGRSSKTARPIMAPTVRTAIAWIDTATFRSSFRSVVEWMR